MFNLEDHINWLALNEDKKPKIDVHGMRQVVSHFYSSGSVCPKTGEKRETEVNIIIVYGNQHFSVVVLLFQVRYKCVKGRYNDDSVALYLLEPKTCKYILTIESPSLCEIINGPLDEHGMFNVKPKSIIGNVEVDSSSSKLEDNSRLIEHAQEKDSVHVDQETEVSSNEKKLPKIEL